MNGEWGAVGRAMDRWRNGCRLLSVQRRVPTSQRWLLVRACWKVDGIGSTPVRCPRDQVLPCRRQVEQKSESSQVESS